MRAAIRTLTCASILLVVAGGAAAESFRVLEGELALAEGGDEPLSGSLELRTPSELQPVRRSPSLTVPPPVGAIPNGRSSVLLVDDFALEAGSWEFGPAAPIEYEGRNPTFYLQIADQIHVDRATGAVGLLRMRVGGERVAADEERVTLRFLDFRSDLSDGGRADGDVDDGGLPRRLVVRGTLHEVDQTFLIDECPVVIVDDLPPPGDGGGGVILSFAGFDIQAGEQVQFASPDGAGGVVARVTGGAGGAPAEGGSVVLAAPILPVSPPGFAALSAPPTLEALGITAPEGAQVTLDGPGGVTVTSAGDLFVAGALVDIPGLTRLTLVTSGSIFVEAGFELPPGIGLSLQSGEVVPPSAGGLTCTGLRAIWPAPEREVGRFSLVAAATRTVDIRVLARHRRGLLGQRKPLAVAILGSDDLDVRDVALQSLRLGSVGAPVLSQRGRWRVRRADVNRDGHADLVAHFDVRRSAIALGDDPLCLVGDLVDGRAIEGCDGIHSWPRGTRHHRKAH